MMRSLHIAGQLKQLLLIDNWKIQLAMPVQCSPNWAMKPLRWEQVQLQCKSEDCLSIRNNHCLLDCVFLSGFLPYMYIFFVYLLVFSFTK